MKGGQKNIRGRKSSSVLIGLLLAAVLAPVRAQGRFEDDYLQSTLSMENGARSRFGPESGRGRRPRGGLGSRPPQGDPRLCRNGEIPGRHLVGKEGQLTFHGPFWFVLRSNWFIFRTR